MTQTSFSYNFLYVELSSSRPDCRQDKIVIFGGMINCRSQRPPIPAPHVWKKKMGVPYWDIGCFLSIPTQSTRNVFGRELFVSTVGGWKSAKGPGGCIPIWLMLWLCSWIEYIWALFFLYFVCLVRSSTRRSALGPFWFVYTSFRHSCRGGKFVKMLYKHDSSRSFSKYRIAFFV